MQGFRIHGGGNLKALPLLICHGFDHTDRRFEQVKPALIHGNVCNVKPSHLFGMFHEVLQEDRPYLCELIASGGEYFFLCRA